MKIALLSICLGLFWALVIRGVSLKFFGTEASLFYFWWFAISVLIGSIFTMLNV